MTVEISRGHNPLRDPEDRRLNRIAGPSALPEWRRCGDEMRAAGVASGSRLKFEQSRCGLGTREADS